jgi:hypothetical protein
MVGGARSDIAGVADQSVVLDFVGATDTRQDHVVDLELEVENDFSRAPILAPTSRASGDSAAEPMWHALNARV